MNKVPIGEVCHVYDGPHATPKKIDKGPVYLGIDAITNDGRLNPAEYNYLSEADYQIWTKRVTPQHNDIVFSYEATLGRYAMIPEGFYGCLGRRLAVVRAKDERINPKWLYYYFLSPEWSAFIANNTVKGSTVNRISIDDFPGFCIPLLDREYQDKVVGVLEAVDRKIDNNKNLCAELESMVKTIYDYWFTQFDFPNEEGKPYRSSGGKMVWNEQLKKEIPKSWTDCKLKDYVDNITDSTQPGDRLSNLFYTPIDEIPKRKMSFFGGLPYSEAKSSLQLYEEDDILIGAMRVYFHRVCVAAQKGITRSTTIVLRSKNMDFLAFIYCLCNHDQTIQYANKISVGTQQPYVNWENALDSMNVIKPTDKIMMGFCEIVAPIIEKVKCVEKENYELTRLRDWLLPMLMNGQATVE